MSTLCSELLRLQRGWAGVGQLIVFMVQVQLLIESGCHSAKDLFTMAGRVCLVNKVPFLGIGLDELVDKGPQAMGFGNDMVLLSIPDPQAMGFGNSINGCY